MWSGVEYSSEWLLYDFMRQLLEKNSKHENVTKIGEKLTLRWIIK